MVSSEKGDASTDRWRFREEVLEMIEEHVTNAVVEVPAAGGPGRGAFYRQVDPSRSRQMQ